MLKLDRLLAIVLMLHAKRLVRASELSSHFGVSLRTIYRDINTLCEAGVPIASEAGVGYSLVKGYSLPPVMFSKDEASALVIASEFLQKMSANTDLRYNAVSAVAKITAVLPEDVKERIQQLQATTAIINQAAVDAQHVALPTVFSDLQRAIEERRCVHIRYTSGDAQHSERCIEPLGMVYYGNSWHCIAYCRLRSDFRDFRTDRFQAVDVSDERFAPRLDFQLLDFLKHQYQSDSPITVRVIFEYRTARYLSNRYYYGFVREERRDNGVEMTFLTPSLFYIARWLFSYADRLHVVEPPELVSMFRDLASAILSKQE